MITLIKQTETGVGQPQQRFWSASFNLDLLSLTIKQDETRPDKPLSKDLAAPLIQFKPDLLIKPV